MRLLPLKETYRKILLCQGIAYTILILAGLRVIISPLLVCAAKDEIWQLNPGETTKREILPSRTHNYQIILSSGQYLHLDINKDDSDIVITLLNPSLQEFAEHWGFQSRIIPLSFIAESHGIYTIKIQLSPGSQSTGYYELKTERLRTATSRDRSMIVAENLIAEGQSLRAEWNSTSLQKAIKKYEGACHYLRAIKDHSAEANTLKYIGDTYTILSQNRKAINHYNQALSLSRKIGSQQTEIETLNKLGGVYGDLGNTKKGLEYCNRALELSRAASYARGEAQALNNTALVHYFLSDLDKALDLFNRAFTLWKGLNDSQGEAEALTNIGYTYSDLGDINKALTNFNQALTLWQKVKDRRGQALVLTALGIEYTWLGEPQKALNSHKEAYQILRDIGDIRGEAVTLNGIGYAYDVLGEKDNALVFFNRALQRQRALGRRYGEAITIGHIGKIYYSLGNNKKALLYYRQKLAILKSLGDPRAEAYTLKDIGTIFDSLKQRGKALNYYNRGLLLSRAAKDPRGQAYSLNSIGYIYDQSGEKQIAIKLYNQALALLNEAEDKAGKILTLYNIARVKRDLGDPAAAINDIRAALHMAEAFRIKVDSQNLRSSYFASVQQYYKLGIELLMSMHQQNPSSGFDAAAFEMSERSRARSLFETLAEARLNFNEGADSTLLQREIDLQRLLNAETERQVALLSAGSRTEHLLKLRAEIAELAKEYEEVRAQIRAASPRYAALTQPQTLTLLEAQQQVVDSNTILLEYSLGEEKSYLWAVTPSSILSYVLPKRAEIEKLSRRVFDLLTSYHITEQGRSSRYTLQEEEIDQQYWQDATRLSRMLLGPVASVLKGKRLLIVTEGALQYIPFSSLPLPDAFANGQGRKTTAPSDPQPLFLKHEIVSLPSASTLAVLRKQKVLVKAPAGAIAVFADPVFETDDPRLKRMAKDKSTEAKANAVENAAISHSQIMKRIRGSAGKGGFARLLASRREAESILDYATKEKSLKAIDFKASLATLANTEMAHYHTIHFASHGFLDTEHPELSAIVLSLLDEEGKPQNGLLRLHEIYNLRLPVDLVVLSACNTALGKDIKGEGLVGITRGFMYAGAARVISSIWKVDDDATAEFMKHFYRKMLQEGESATTALRSAQTEMWKQERWKSPYYWASFVFQGEWK